MPPVRVLWSCLHPRSAHASRGKKSTRSAARRLGVDRGRLQTSYEVSGLNTAARFTSPKRAPLSAFDLLMRLLSPSAVATPLPVNREAAGTAPCRGQAPERADRLRLHLSSSATVPNDLRQPPDPVRLARIPAPITRGPDLKNPHRLGPIRHAKHSRVSFRQRPRSDEANNTSSHRALCASQQHDRNRSHFHEPDLVRPSAALQRLSPSRGSSNPAIPLPEPPKRIYDSIVRESKKNSRQKANGLTWRQWNRPSRVETRRRAEARGRLGIYVFLWSRPRG